MANSMCVFISIYFSSFSVLIESFYFHQPLGYYSIISISFSRFVILISISVRVICTEKKNINKTRLIGLFSSKSEFTSEIKALMNVIRVKTSEATAPFDLMANKHKFTYLMDSGRSRDK